MSMDKALQLLRDEPTREIYRAVDNFFYVTYSPHIELRLTQEQVDNAVQSGQLKINDRGIGYVLSSPEREP